MSFSLTFSPPQISLILRPGGSYVRAYEVTNNGDTDLNLTTEISQWLPADSDGNVTYLPSADSNFAFKLNNADLRLGQAFILPAHGHRQLVLKISSTPQTSLSDAYFTFFVSQNTDPSSTQATIGKIGSHILISTSTTSDIQPQISLTDFSPSPRLLDTFLSPITFHGLIQNSSPHHTLTVGQLTLTKNGQKLTKLQLAPQNVLAQHTRTLLCQPDIKEPQFSPCQIQPPFWPGLYTATVEFDPSLNAPPTSLTFFVFPYSVVLPLILLAILLAGLKLLRHRK